MEPASVAFPDKSDVDANYAHCTHALLERTATTLGSPA